ncbi:nucleopolyhedrovirus P10 family protein, partial [Streptomyces sp. NPDC058735]
APPTALPPGPLTVTARFAATASQPLPRTASLVRATLAAAATEGIGLTVTEVDLRVTDLLEQGEDERAQAAPGAGHLPEPSPTPPPRDGDEARVATAALAVPGVLHLTGMLGHPVHIAEVPGEAELPHRHVRVELAVDAGRPARDVARAVREAVAESLPDRPTVAVLVSAIA